MEIGEARDAIGWAGGWSDVPDDPKPPCHVPPGSLSPYEQFGIPPWLSGVKRSSQTGGGGEGSVKSFFLTLSSAGKKNPWSERG